MSNYFVVLVKVQMNTVGCLFMRRWQKISLENPLVPRKVFKNPHFRYGTELEQRKSLLDLFFISFNVIFTKLKFYINSF